MPGSTAATKSGHYLRRRLRRCVAGLRLRCRRQASRPPAAGRSAVGEAAHLAGRRRAEHCTARAAWRAVGGGRRVFVSERAEGPLTSAPRQEGGSVGEEGKYPAQSGVTNDVSAGGRATALPLASVCSFSADSLECVRAYISTARSADVDVKWPMQPSSPAPRGGHIRTAHQHGIGFVRHRFSSAIRGWLHQ